MVDCKKFQKNKLAFKSCSLDSITHKDYILLARQMLTKIDQYKIDIPKDCCSAVK